MRYLIAGLLLLVSSIASAATVQFTLSWEAPTTGGPVTEYAAVCTDASGATVLDVLTTETSAEAITDGVAEGQGECLVTAIGPGGSSEAVAAAFSIGITAPPGPPTNFQIVLECEIVDGAVSCEQV